MLPLNLTTNEVKNQSGTEVEFGRIKANDRLVTYSKVGAAPNLDHTLSISHTVLGSGVDERRRTAILGYMEVTGASGAKRIIRVNHTYDIPIGDIASYTDVILLDAEVGSFTYLDGTGSTFLYAGTGTGASAAVNGTV
jgi:hypothetical protein